MTLLTIPLVTMEDGIFKVTATAGDAHLGTEDFDNQIVDVRMQDSKGKNRGKDLAGHHPAMRHVRTECQRAKRTLSSSTQATREIDALLDGTAFPLAFSKVWFKELNVDYFRNSKGPVERCLGDGGIDMRSVQKMIQEFLNGKEPNRPINLFFWQPCRLPLPPERKMGLKIAERRLRTQCERAMRILSSSTQEVIDSLFDGTDCSLFEQLNMYYLTISKGAVE